MKLSFLTTATAVFAICHGSSYADSTDTTANQAAQSVEVPTENSSDEEIYILSDFAVSAADDQGYFSANSNSATRTNSLVKNTPITMSIVNEELLSDLDIQSNEDLAAVVAGIDSDPDGYSLDRIRIRGYRSASSRYDYFPRNIPRNGYNVNRVDVIKGANSLIFGQASPGGSINTIPELASFHKDTQVASYTLGNKNYRRSYIKLNHVISDKLAVKLMGVNVSQGYDHTYKENTFEGATLAISYKPTAKTNLRFHLEQVNTDTAFPARAMKDATKRDDDTLFDSDTKNDDYNGVLSRTNYEVPYTPDYVDYLPQAVVDHLISTSSQINSRSDIKGWYDGIDASNYGSVTGPDKITQRDGHFLIANLNHEVTENLQVEVAISSQEIETNSIKRDSFASKVRHHFTLPYQATDKDPDTAAPEQKTQHDVGEPFIKTHWEREFWDAKRDGLKTTFLYDGDNPLTSVGAHKLIFGFDYDARTTYNESDDMIPIGILRTDGSYVGQDKINNSRFTDKDRSSEYFAIDSGFDPSVMGIRFDFETSSNVAMLPLDGTTSLPTNSGGTTFPDYTLPIYDEDPDSEWALGKTQYSKINNYSQWFALQSEFLSGRLHTLIGARYDYIDIDSSVRKVSVHGFYADDQYNNETSTKYQKLSPSLGLLYWLNPQVGVFANYAESIDAPSNTARTPIGDIAPPQYGRGLEGGIRFTSKDKKLDGQFVYYMIEKENDDEFPYSTALLNAIYPAAQYGEAFPDLYYRGGAADNEPPLGFIKQAFMVGSRAVGDKTLSTGLELEFTYNPSKALAFIFSYNHNIDNSITGLHPTISSELQNTSFYQGDQLPGRPDHRANFTARYKFLSGKLKNLSVGLNQIWRSPSMVTFFNLPDGSQHPLRLGDEFTTNLFMNYSFKLKGNGRQPKVSLGLNINNVFDNTDLINRGNYAFYKEGRVMRLMTKIAF